MPCITQRGPLPSRPDNWRSTPRPSCRFRRSARAGGSRRSVSWRNCDCNPARSAAAGKRVNCYTRTGSMRVTVVGTGYVGTVTGACLAYLGHRVTCVDTDERKIARLRSGDPVIYEPGLEQLLALAPTRGGIDFTTDLSGPACESDAIFIAVG